eukprot:gene20217-22192_t
MATSCDLSEEGDSMTEDIKDGDCNGRAEFSEISLDVIRSSSSTICRICQDSRNSREALISPCKCSGSMGFFHVSCLEKWLAHSQSNKCEVCKFEYKTIRVSKPITDWFHRGCRPMDRRYAFVDLFCFTLLTPLGCVSCWLCIQGALDYYKTSEPWTGFALIMLSTFLLIMYMFWVSITVKYHITTYLKWRRRNQTVEILLENNHNSEGTLA